MKTIGKTCNLTVPCSITIRSFHFIDWNLAKRELFHIYLPWSFSKYFFEETSDLMLLSPFILRNFKQNIKSFFCYFNFYSYLFSIYPLVRQRYCNSVSWVLLPSLRAALWEIVCLKNLTIFKGFRYSRFYIMIS